MGKHIPSSTSPGVRKSMPMIQLGVLHTMAMSPVLIATTRLRPYWLVCQSGGIIGRAVLLAVSTTHWGMAALPLRRGAVRMKVVPSWKISASMGSMVTKMITDEEKEEKEGEGAGLEDTT